MEWKSGPREADKTCEYPTGTTTGGLGLAVRKIFVKIWGLNPKGRFKKRLEEWVTTSFLESRWDRAVRRCQFCVHVYLFTADFFLVPSFEDSDTPCSTTVIKKNISRFLHLLNEWRYQKTFFLWKILERKKCVPRKSWRTPGPWMKLTSAYRHHPIGHLSWT